MKIWKRRKGYDKSNLNKKKNCELNNLKRKKNYAWKKLNKSKDSVAEISHLTIKIEAEKNPEVLSHRS